MSIESIIILGGIYNICFIVFHLFFWKIFNWKEELQKIRFINRGVMQVLNLCLTFAFFIFAFISIFFTQEMINTNLGKTLLLLISIFWFLRAIEQIIFFKLKTIVSVIFLIVFICGTIIYLLPFILITIGSN